MRKVKTHFEQVPVEWVKKIAEGIVETEELDEKEIETANAVRETPVTKTEPYSVGILMHCKNRA